MGKKIDKRESTLIAVKVFDFLSNFFFFMFGSALMILLITSPILLKIPPLRAALAVGMIGLPFLFRTLAIMIIQIGFSKRYGWFIWTLLSSLGFFAVTGVAVKQNMGKALKLYECLSSQGTNLVGNMVEKAASEIKV